MGREVVVSVRPSVNQIPATFWTLGVWIGIHIRGTCQVKVMVFCTVQAGVTDGASVL